MGTFLFDDVVFGPIKSRRLGHSLGINLLSTDAKLCNFDCIYCECGWSDKFLLKQKSFVDKSHLFQRLEGILKDLKIENCNLDCITFAGNGEPTLHPHFNAIIDKVISLRDHYYPNSKVSVLSNATTIQKDSVWKALQKVDYSILKLDAGTEELFQIINAPLGKLKLSSVVEKLKNFDGQMIIQSIFFSGEVDGEYIDNSNQNEVKKWLEKIKYIHPKKVMIYTIDRDTPLDSLEKIPISKLNSIAALVRKEGIEVSVN